MLAAVFYLVITAGPYDDLYACEMSKLRALDVPGPAITYRCHMEGTPVETAPVNAPLPPRKPEVLQ